jgi:hypothetical protein
MIKTNRRNHSLFQREAALDRDSVPVDQNGQQKIEFAVV